MTRITAAARKSIIMGMAVARDQHRRNFANGIVVDGEIRPVQMNHEGVIIDILIKHGFNIEMMSRSQIDSLVVEFDHMEARDASNARIGLIDRRVALAPTHR